MANKSTKMDVDTDSGKGSKRIVNADDYNEVVRDPKKPKIDLNPELREKIIDFIISSHLGLLEKSGIKDASDNISVGCQIQNVLFTCYTVKRQSANATRGGLESRISAVDFTITHLSRKYTIPKADAYKTVEDAAAEAGIPFVRHQMNSPDNWYGIASPLLNFLSGYDLRMNELRLGHHEMRVKKDGGIPQVIKLAQYGIYGCHHVLLEGVTFPPEKRTAMAQSLGPLTIIMNLIKADPAYSAKWEIAAKRAFAHFPNIDSIIPLLKGKKTDEVRNLVHAMGDLALLTTTRQASRMFPPPNAFVKILKANPGLKKFFNFSGKGAFMFYKKMSEMKWTMNGNMTQEQASQICYHSMFGTYKEDLSVLAQVTKTATWYTREQFGKCMIQQNTCGKKVSFQPPEQVFYSKLCSANQTSLLSSNYTQLSTQPVFSGYRVQKFRDDFFEYLKERRSNTIVEKSNFNLVQELRAEIDDISKRLDSTGRSMNMGTTTWFAMEELTDAGVEKAVGPVPVQAAGICFLGKNK